jgi:hypothetical protein
MRHCKLRQSENVVIVPTTSADSMRYIISLLLATGTDYRMLWDNDDTGRSALKVAETHFGQEEARKRFRLLPISEKSKARKRILQDLFDGSDITSWRISLGLPENASFEKVLMGVYYFPQRSILLESCSTITKQNFADLFDSLWNEVS